MSYPSYYLQPFHAYEDGNLNWLAAFEVEPASYAMALRTFKTEQLSPDVAMTKLREGINSRITVSGRGTGGKLGKAGGVIRSAAGGNFVMVF